MAPVDLGTLVFQLKTQIQGTPVTVLVSTVLLATLVLLVVSRVLGNTVINSLQKRPPVFEGIPFIGGLLKFVVDKPMKLMTEGYAKYGEAFTVPVAHK